MSDYDDAFAAATGPAKNEPSPYDEIMAGIAPKGMAAPAVKPKKEQGTGSAALDTGNAIGTGYWRGLTNLVGLPVDTAANVLDLGKAALGGGYIAATGKAPPSWLEVSDRSNVLGSGANLHKNLVKTAPGRVMLNPANPDYEGGYAQAAGAGLTAVMSPNSALQAGNQAGLGVLGAMGGKAAYDLTGDPSAAVAASLLPGGVQQAATAGVKRLVRGGEAGRAAMEQRIQDLKVAGVQNPTLGLASGNKLIGGVENLLQSTPGAINIMGKARQEAINGLQAKAEEAAALASSNRGSTAAGMAIQRGLTGNFKDRIKDSSAALYDELDQHISPQQPTPVNATIDTLNNLTATIPNARNVSQRFVNGRIKSLADDFAKDTEGAPATVMVYPQPPKAGSGLMNPPIEQPPLLVQVPQGPATNKLPWEAVKKTRTMVGNELADGALVSGVPDRQWRALYGGLSEDMGNAARATSPEATAAFNRASGYHGAAMGRLERVAPFANATAPEQAFNSLLTASQEGGALSTLQAVKKSLPQDARGQVAGTVIDKLGRATNSQQNESSTAWSPETFLTNWNKMSPKARDEMFSGFPNSSAVKDHVEAVAKATSMMRDSSKMWANPSGTGANQFARGLLTAVGVGGGASLAGLLNPMIPLGAGVGLLGANRLAASLTNPNNVNAMARRGYVSPELLRAQSLGLLNALPQGYEAD